MSDMRAELGALEGLAGKLRESSGRAENGPDPAPVPEAGECTSALNSVMGQFTESVAGVVEGLDALGTAVDDTRGIYAEMDASAADTLNQQGM